MGNHINGAVAAGADGDKVRQQRTILGNNREVTLMVTHRGNDSLTGQSHIFIVNPAGQSGGPLNEEGYLLKKCRLDLCLTGLAVCIYTAGCHSGNLCFNHVTALYGAGDDLHGLAFLHIFLRLADIKLTAGRVKGLTLNIGEDTMTAGSTAGLDFGYLKGNYLGTAESNNPANRTEELEVKVAPAHGVGQRKSIDEFREESGKKLLGLLADSMNLGIYIAITLNEVFRRGTCTFGKAENRLGWITVCIKGSGNSRATALYGLVRLALSHIINKESKTARGTHSVNSAVGKPQLLKTSGGLFTKCPIEASYCMSRKLFGTNFKKNIYCHFTSPPPFCSCPSWDSPASRAAQDMPLRTFWPACGLDRYRRYARKH